MYHGMNFEAFRSEVSARYRYNYCNNDCASIYLHATNYPDLASPPPLKFGTSNSQWQLNMKPLRRIMKKLTISHHHTIAHPPQVHSYA